MRHRHTVNITERPAFVSLVNTNQTNELVTDDYILQIDIENHSANIINSKKGGKKAVVKTIVKAKEGWEDVFELISRKKETFEAEFEQAKAVAIAEVEQRFASKRAEIENFFEQASEVEEIEEADDEEAEVVDTPEETVEQ